MHAICHAILRTISIPSPDQDTQALERAPVFCCARVFFDAVRAALRVAIDAAQTQGLILRHELGLSVYCPVMPLPQSSLNPMCTYPDVLLYILLFPFFRVARILKRFVT